MAVERSSHRALLKSLGLTDEDMTKPFIGIANSYTNIVPGHVHLRAIGEAVKEGILAAGGTPFEFNTIAVCDGIAMGHEGMRYSLPSRELIADSVEIMMQAPPPRRYGHRLELRQDHARHAYGGGNGSTCLQSPSQADPWSQAYLDGQKVGVNDVFEVVGKVFAGKMN